MGRDGRAVHGGGKAGWSPNGKDAIPGQARWDRRPAVADDGGAARFHEEPFRDDIAAILQFNFYFWRPAAGKQRPQVRQESNGTD